jgi:hypothetical protein
MIEPSPFSLIDGVVVDTSDPLEMGRLKVWCPSIDGDNTDVDTLPWATYVSPLAGHAYDYPAGGSGGPATGPVSYGMWAIPKIGAKVLIGFLYGDYGQRIYLGSFYRDFGNRSLPAGRNRAGDTPSSDSDDSIEPSNTNLKAQFGGDLSSSIAKTRGAYERMVAQPETTKTVNEGYSPRVLKDSNPNVGALDPQTYCLTTPGRHSIIMQDYPEFARVRIKTAEGHQVIFDDANERIYISTSLGKTWVELDVDGHVHIHGAASISMAAGEDINISALGNVNIAAGKNLNLQASESLRAAACKDMSLTGDEALNLTSGAGFNVLAAGELIQHGSKIHLNGPKPAPGPCPSSPTLTPSHEPWERPATKGTRNKNWRA